MLILTRASVGHDYPADKLPIFMCACRERMRNVASGAYTLDRGRPG